MTKPRTIVIFAWLLTGTVLQAATLFPAAKSFIENNCADCHDSTTKEAGLDLTALQFEP
jgi:hypothetical protein